MINYTLKQCMAAACVITGLLLAIIPTNLNAQVYNPPTGLEYTYPSGVISGRSLHSSNYLFFDYTLAAYDDGNSGQVIWQHINGANLPICQGVVNYGPGISHIEVGGLMGNNSGLPYTAFVAYHKLGSGHYVDLYDWDPSACNFNYSTTHTLSSEPDPTRISMDCHKGYALAIAWVDAGILKTRMYEGGGATVSWGFIHTLQPVNIKQHDVDVAFSHEVNLLLHYVYNDPGFPAIEVVSENFWVMRTAGGPTVYIPTFEDLNPVGTTNPIFCNIDGPDHNYANWAYTYTEDYNNISVRLIDLSTGTPPTTFIVNDGSMGNAPNNFNFNYNPTIAYDNTYEMINVGWVMQDPIESYIGVEIKKHGGGVTSSLDYLTIPNTPSDVSPTPIISFSKTTELKAPWLYAFYSEFDYGSALYKFQHKFHDMGNNTSFKTSHAHNCKDEHRIDAEQASINLEKLEVFPNPFSSSFRIDDSKMAVTGDVDVFLHDITGKLVFSFAGKLNAANQALKTSSENLSNGTYILKVESVESELSESWEVQKQD